MTGISSSSSYAGGGLAHRRGQVLVIMLLSMAVLVGLVLFVFNLGDQVNRRLELQNAADSAAISGASWLARCMNTIAMNNLAQARMIALVPILDALPLAVEMTLKDVESWEQMLVGLARQINSSSLPRNSKERAMLWQAIANMISVYDGGSGSATMSKTDLLKDANSALTDGFYMEDITHWPGGSLWQAAIALGEISQATAESAGELAQQNAVRFARESGADAAFLLPASPALPYQEGTFDSFEPVMIGRLQLDCDTDELPLPQTAEFESPDSKGYVKGQYLYDPTGGAIPYESADQDGPEFKPYRLGPFFKIFGWRKKVYEGGRYISTAPGIDSGMTGISRGYRQGGVVFRSGYFEPSPELIGYHSYGPYSWALTKIGLLEQLWDTHFRRYLRDIAKIKLRYMFEGGPFKSVNFPEWITDYARALQIGTSEPGRIKETRMYRIRIISSVQRGLPDWLGETTVKDSQGNDVTTPTFISTHLDPEIRWWKSWRDPAGFGGTRVGALPIWKKQYQGTVSGRLPQIGLFDNGPHTLYHLDWWIFIGVDVGEDVVVSDPSKGRGSGDGPRPILLDTADGDYEPNEAGRSDGDIGARRAFFTYLGVAGKGNKARAWPTRFAPANPHDQMVAVAQARVFNNESWDLWTQTWQAKLVPVTRFGPAEDGLSWKSAMSEALGSAIYPIDERGVDLGPFAEYFSAISDEMAEMYFNH